MNCVLYLCKTSNMAHLGNIVIYCPHVSDAYSHVWVCIHTPPYVDVSLSLSLPPSLPRRAAFIILTHPRSVRTHTCTRTQSQRLTVYSFPCSAPLPLGRVRAKPMCVCVCVCVCVCSLHSTDINIEAHTELASNKSCVIKNPHVMRA